MEIDMVIHPMMYNTGTGTCTCGFDTDVTETEWVTYTVEPAEEEIPLERIKHVWPVAIHQEPHKVFRDKFIRRFRGSNKGRHWDRKRK